MDLPFLDLGCSTSHEMYSGSKRFSEMHSRRNADSKIFTVMSVAVLVAPLLGGMVSARAGYYL